eukprot:649462-Prymnesium_polylepis.1
MCDASAPPRAGASVRVQVQVQVRVREFRARVRARLSCACGGGAAAARAAAVGAHSWSEAMLPEPLGSSFSHSSRYCSRTPSGTCRSSSPAEPEKFSRMTAMTRLSSTKLRRRRAEAE